jgi:hypothetical protein
MLHIHFITIGAGIEKLMGDTQTHRQHGDLISPVLFFLENFESFMKQYFNSVFHRVLLYSELS